MTEFDRMRDEAETHLVMRGVKILDRNWKTDEGRLDLIGEENRILVVAIVRPRRPGDLRRVATVRRQRRMAIQWLKEHGMRYDQIRVDLVDVWRDGTIELVKDMGR